MTPLNTQNYDCPSHLNSSNWILLYDETAASGSQTLSCQVRPSWYEDLVYTPEYGCLLK